MATSLLSHPGDPPRVGSRRSRGCRRRRSQNKGKTTTTIMDKVPQITIRGGWCKGCTYCVAFCPKHVLSMAGSLPVATDPAQCTRCLLCVYVCPDFAIKVE